jgi:uncharacterized protein
MDVTFASLLIGFILLIIGHFGHPIMNTIAAYDLLLCALSAWYMMAGIIINDLAGKTVVPFGKPLIRISHTVLSQAAEPEYCQELEVK